MLLHFAVFGILRDFGVLCAHDYKKRKTIGFFSMLNFAVEAQFKM